MAISLPSSPTIGQTYTLGGKIWTWNGTAWKLPSTTGVLPVLYGGTGVTTSTGTGNNVLSASPTFTGTVSAATITASGDVAIGASAIAPASKLHIRQDQDGTTRQIIQNRNATGTPLTELTFLTGGIDFSDTRYAYIQSGGNTSNYISFGTSNGAVPTEKMRINSVGTVSIPGTLSTAAYTETTVALGTVTTAATIEINTGTIITATLSMNIACFFTMPTVAAGKSFILLLKQAASVSVGPGSAYFTNVKWGVAGAPTISVAAGKMDILSFVSDGTSWYGSAAQGYTY